MPAHAARLADARPLALGLLSALLFAQALRAFFASVYYHNLTALGLNETALAALLLLAPLVYLLPRALLPARPTLLAALATLVLARAAMNLSWGTTAFLALSGIAAGAWLVALPLLLVQARGTRGGPGLLALGVALGFALDAALALLFDSLDPTVLPRWWPLPLALGAAALALALPVWPAPAAAEARPRRAWPAGLALGAWLYLENATWGSAFAIARWSELPLAAATLGALGGVLLAALATLAPARATRGGLLALNAFAVAAALDMGLLHSPLLPALLVLGKAALVLDLVLVLRALARAGHPGAGRAAIAAGATLLVLHFAQAFSFTFAYVPLGDLWVGLERFLPAIAVALVLLGLAAATPGLREGLALPRPPRAPVAALLALVVLASGIGLAPHETATTQDSTLRVATFNVHQAFNNQGMLDADLMVDVARELDADILVLQESSTTRFTSGNVDVAHRIARELGYHVHHGPPASEQSVGLAILSRHPITHAQSIPLPTYTDNRFLLEARLDVDGTPLRVYGVHFGLPYEDRTVQTQALLARVRDDAPHLLVGDFNSCPDGRCPDFDGPADDIYAKLTRTYADAWTAAGHARDDPAGHTYEARTPTHRIDYVFASEGVTVLEAERVRTPNAIAASDHLPVVATVALDA